ncbi:hypothetical protein GK047_27670 [Paenibacillus sp. SYP-B3998]|uniref:Uncharacterized protein n=1 Tax=Paenibacillus sp. SYP-B3998 TaxID=2678564 RepID=A0A6G4A5V9_9BACL|nr:hypothetical protein [Paenibacillus sp. SYP-B3998]NEW09710.1 hypothetical protein [Paenibacillus sp. SYP-B3998]
MLTKLRSVEKMGIITTVEFQVHQREFHLLISDYRGLDITKVMSLWVWVGVLFTKNELRDDLLDIAQLEDLMFLNICEYYAFLVGRKDKHMWIREHIPSLI